MIFPSWKSVVYIVTKSGKYEKTDFFEVLALDPAKG